LPNEQWTPAVGNPNVGIQAINDKVRTTSAWVEPLRQQMASVIVGQDELIAGNFLHFFALFDRRALPPQISCSSKGARSSTG
jgi:hypothetical protein